MVAKVTATQKALDNVEYMYNLLYAETKREFTDQEVLQQAFRRNPTEPVYDSTNKLAGGYFRNTGPFQHYNPVAMINEETSVVNSKHLPEVAKGTYNILPD